jgi:CBS domain-containing protein
MQTADVMTTNVIVTGPGAGVREIAGLLLKHRFSAVPVTDAEQRVVGIVSEGDLVRLGSQKGGQSRGGRGVPRSMRPPADARKEHSASERHSYRR